MTTLDRLIAQLLRRNEDGSLAEITESEQQQAADALQSQAERIKELEAEAEQLRTAAQAVIDRWDTPHWKAVPATAEYIGRLRAALGEKP